MTNVCVAGITGWTGSAVARGIRAADDLALVGGIARSGGGGIGVPVHTSIDGALDGVDVLVEYTSHEVAKAHTLAALERGIGVVIGSSGLTAEDFAEIEAAATGAGVIASGNFSLTAAMMQAAALLAARHLPSWEVIDYASATKPDVPSGTARELAEKLGASQVGRSVAEVAGPREARGADVAGTQVHSVRLPSFVVSTEVVFGLPDERLTIRHDAGSTPDPYVGGTLLAVRRVVGMTGVVRGLAELLVS
jgi:4-hydroxy-tetrahydrodipicolinate reductase